MASGLDHERLRLVFGSSPDLVKGIQLAADTPARVALFNSITSFVHDQLASDEPSVKRRRVDVSSTNGHPAASSPSTIKATTASDVLADSRATLRINEISVSLPQRKKYDLLFTKSAFSGVLSGKSGEPPSIHVSWADIEYLFYVPVPEKAQVQHNYVIFPRGTCIPSKDGPPKDDVSGKPEPIIFTIPATAPKQGTVTGEDASSAAAVSDTYSGLLHWALRRYLRAAGNTIDIEVADPTVFHSVIRQPHRPSDKAVHVKAFRGSKDGYLFFLDAGVLWGFKKPLLFASLNRIAAISYTNVLQRTFNMVVEVFTDGEATDEIEFGMLDQEDYAGIDTYIKRNRLQDRSMAERRRAKLELPENRRKAQADGDDEQGEALADGEGMTELERAHREAEQQIQDDEDDLEEDYDPGSDGDSDGSGEDSDDGEEDGDAADSAGDEDEDDEEEEDEEEEE